MRWLVFVEHWVLVSVASSIEWHKGVPTLPTAQTLQRVDYSS